MKVGISEFLQTGLNLKTHLAQYLKLNPEEVERILFRGSEDLAALHPGSLLAENVSNFYEDEVGTAHLSDLASWHLGSSEYIANTLRLQANFARGKVLDFGGGIGTHALCAAALPEVDHVWFVDLNPQNRKFVMHRAEQLGLGEMISFHRDLDQIQGVEFDTVVCLDVLEHLPDPSAQLVDFHKIISSNGMALFNWYFYKGDNNEYPFHFDDKELVEKFFRTLQKYFIEIFHPYLITTRSYKKS